MFIFSFNHLLLWLSVLFFTKTYAMLQTHLTKKDLFMKNLIFVMIACYRLKYCASFECTFFWGSSPICTHESQKVDMENKSCMFNCTLDGCRRSVQLNKKQSMIWKPKLWNCGSIWQSLLHVSVGSLLYWLQFPTLPFVKNSTIKLDLSNLVNFKC